MEKSDRQACMQVGRQTPTSTPTPTPDTDTDPEPGPYGPLGRTVPIRAHKDTHTYIYTYVSIYSTPKRFAR